MRRRPGLGMRLLSFGLSLSLILPPAAWPRVVQANIDFTQSLDNAVRLADRLRVQVNRAAFDLKVMLDELDYDDQKIINFVRTNIAFEQYAGLLRGPQGTLMSQAGNALDQSVLLAKLLRDAGFDARVQRGELSETDARQLLSQMSRSRGAEPIIGNVRAALEILTEEQVIPEMPPDQFDSATSELQRSRLLKNMPEFKAFEATRKLIEEAGGDSLFSHVDEIANATENEARDYYWVEYKNSAADPWTAVQPVFAGDSAFAPPDVKETLEDEVPAALQHRLRLQFFMEKRVGGSLKSVAVSSPWERPAANLVTAPQAFAVLPDSAFAEGAAVKLPGELLESAKYFVPILGPGMAPGGQYFDQSGNIIDPMAGSTAQAGIFKEVGRAFGDAAAGIGGESVRPILTACWIEITRIAPGGHETTVRRMMLDRVGPAARNSGKGIDTLTPPTAAELRPLMRTNTLIVATGRTPRGMAIDSVLGDLRNVQKALVTILISKSSGSPTSTDTTALKNVPLAWSGYLPLLNRMDAIESWSDDQRIYRNAPMVMIHTAGAGEKEGAMNRIDIVSNPRRGFVAKNNDVWPSPRALVAAGVWETLTEGSFFHQSESRRNTKLVFDAAQAQSIPLRTVRTVEALSELKLAPDARQNLRAELENGYAAVVPQSTPDGQAQTGWWRVDPRTGETLGQLEDGRGVEITEYMVVATFGIISLILLHVQLAQCFFGYEPGVPDADLMLVCCVLFNYATFVGGTALGVGIAAGFAKAASYFMSGASAAAAGEMAAGAAGTAFDGFDMGFGLDEQVCGAIIN